MLCRVRPLAKAARCRAVSGQASVARPSWAITSSPLLKRRRSSACGPSTGCRARSDGQQSAARPRRLLQLSLPEPAALPDKLQASVHRPAAPTLSGERVKASFLRSCPPEQQKRVRTLAGRGFVACLYEIEVEVGLDGTRPERRCRIDNADSPLEDPQRALPGALG